MILNRNRLTGVAIGVAVLISGCTSSEGNSTQQDDVSGDALTRVDALQSAVTQWQQSATIADAHAAAETALNLVVGPDGPRYGDLDGDSSTGGENTAGLLPGIGGELGLAQTEPVNDCVEADVLGGSWEDPAARWSAADDALAAWSATNNTMPTLASHPQRIYGWASLTLASNDLDEAHEYAGHAQIHVDVTVDAVEHCA